MPGWLPYRGDSLPRRNPSRYVLKEKSLSKRILALLMFVVTGLALGYLIGQFFHLTVWATVFVCTWFFIFALIIYFAKEDLEKIDIHDAGKVEDKSDND